MIVSFRTVSGESLPNCHREDQGGGSASHPRGHPRASVRPGGRSRAGAAPVEEPSKDGAPDVLLAKTYADLSPPADTQLSAPLMAIPVTPRRCP